MSYGTSWTTEKIHENHQVTGQTKGTHDEIRGKAERNPFCMIIIFNFLFFFFPFGCTACPVHWVDSHNSYSPQFATEHLRFFFPRRKLFPSLASLSSLRIQFESLQWHFMGWRIIFNGLLV